MMDFDKLCSCCFARKAPTEPCPECGYSGEGEAMPGLYLPYGSILSGKYMAGMLVEFNDMAATYLGFDINQQSRVNITEFLPQSMVQRTPEAPVLTVLTEAMEPSYMAGLTAFREQAEKLCGFRNINIAAVQEYFEENNTGYLVTDYVAGLPLMAELSEHRFACAEALTIMMPLLAGLSALHSFGCSHLNISPAAITVQKSGLPILTGIGLPQAQQPAFLASGYASLEQYQGGVAGTFTDVYALAAVFYHMVTGTAPPNAVERAKKDALQPVGKKAADVPKPVQAVIMKALRLKPKARYATATAFYNAMLAATQGAAAQKREQKQKRRKSPQLPPGQEPLLLQEQGQEPQQQLPKPPMDKKRKQLRWIIWGITGVLALALAICFILFGIPMIRYGSATNDLKEGRYDEAIAVFSELGSYGDAPERVLEAQQEKADAFYEEKQFADAIVVYDLLLTSDTSEEQKDHATYYKAGSLFQMEKYTQARELFEELDDYLDAADMALKCRYQYAITLENAGTWDAAFWEYNALGEYEDAVTRSENCCIRQLELVLRDQSISEKTRDEWMARALGNSHTKSKAHTAIQTVLSDKIAAGANDYVYGIIMEKLSSYPDKYTKQAYELANTYISSKEYQKACDLLDWISAQGYKDTADLLLECRYQLLLMLVAKEPDDMSTLTQLYAVAKMDYKDSREIMNTICSPEMLLNLLTVGTPTMNESDSRYWYWTYWGYTYLYEYKYKFGLYVENNSPLPIKGTLEVKFKAPYAPSASTSGDTKTKTFSIAFSIGLKMGDTYSKTKETEWLAGKPTNIIVKSGTGKNKLTIDYGK